MISAEFQRTWLCYIGWWFERFPKIMSQLGYGVGLLFKKGNGKYNVKESTNQLAVLLIFVQFCPAGFRRKACEALAHVFYWCQQIWGHLRCLKSWQSHKVNHTFAERTKPSSLQCGEEG